ncbi:Gp49 family protein [Acinetobacter towneri]|uniref:Gp49 family protein n=1 Tax=Acinetobacter towneri TaxID=202956 RepID=UPI00209B76C1|nr:Gp49 family protein [Acinetobacter towneri]MCO8056089.1 Gp49 family protein [Acinetobacter towneri]
MPYQKEQAKSKCAVIEPATEQQIEQEIQEKGLNAPRLTPEHIDSIILSEHYFTAADGAANADNDYDPLVGAPSQLYTLTFCVLVLKNGFTVTGESACVSPENFDEAIGQKIAYDNAVNKIWQLEGYLLKERLSS